MNIYKLKVMLDELESSYKKVVDCSDIFGYIDDEYKDTIVLHINLDLIDEIFQGLLNTPSRDEDQIQYRANLMPSIYIKFIRVITDIICATVTDSFNTGNSFKFNEILLFADLSYVANNGYSCNRENKITFEEFSDLRYVMSSFIEDYIEYVTGTLNNGMDIKLGDFVNEELDQECIEKEMKYDKNIFFKAFVNIRSFFRGDILSLARTYLDVQDMKGRKEDDKFSNGDYV